MSGGKVLVFGDDTRSFLAIVRSLGRQGIIAHAAPGNFRSPALRSRYIAAIHDLPPWMGDDPEWLAALTPLLRDERYELIIPCNETTLLPLQRHRGRLFPLARLAIPDDRSIAVLFDKHETRALALRLGIRVAAGRLLHANDTAEAVLAEFGAPVVLKPRRSYSLDNLAARGKVQVLGETTGLAAVLRGLDPSETLVERYFGGQGVGVSVLASRGRLLQAFEHRRAREIAGASFYRHSAPLTPDLVAASEAMIAALDYTGIAMFEFKMDANGDWVLLEVNARPWGSMPLPVTLGVDFPYRWYRLLVAGEESPAVDYRAGVYGRNLVPDLRFSLQEAADGRRGWAAMAWFMLGRGMELLRVFTGRDVHDVLISDDPRPGLFELQEIAHNLGRRAANLLPGAAGRRRRRARTLVAALPRNTAQVLIVFVCQGNICRSPFAAALLRTGLSADRISITSAGMMPQPGRSTPGFGLDAAAAYGVDLAAHRSAWLTPELAEAASLLIVFDEITRCAVLDRYPQTRPRLMLLGDIAGVGEIPDPIDGDAAEFRRIYGAITTAITKLSPLLAGPYRGSAA